MEANGKEEIVELEVNGVHAKEAEISEAEKKK